MEKVAILTFILMEIGMLKNLQAPISPQIINVLTH